MKLILKLICFSPVFCFSQTDTIKIYFDIGRFETNEKELQKLDVNKSDWKKVDIISYTDYLGSESKNDKLSLNRSLEIRSRLVEKGLNTETLEIVEGRGIVGEVLESKTGIQENRRTDVIITKREVSNGAAPEIRNDVTKEVKPLVEKVELKSQIESAKVGDQLVLSNMIFLPGQHFLTEESTATYLDLLELLKENPNLKIVIEGHICCKIDEEDGLDLATNKYNLSEARAEFIYNILIDDGISADRLSYEGFARTKPLYPLETTEEEKIANRRVEIRIIEK